MLRQCRCHQKYTCEQQWELVELVSIARLKDEEQTQRELYLEISALLHDFVSIVSIT
jgi:hypothetical protein